MDEHDAEEVKAVGTQLRKAIGDDFKWEWDSRFQGALTQFEKSNAQLILNALSQVFAHKWTVTNIDNAPEAVLIAADFLGGLRPGQYLFTTDPQNDLIHIGAFWPWANGATISLRIIPFAENLPPSALTQWQVGLQASFTL